MWPGKGPCGEGASLQLEDMLLLLVVGCNLTDGVSQGQGLLPMVGHPQCQVLGILVEGQLTVPEHTVEVVPGPAEIAAGSSHKSGCNTSAINSYSFAICFLVIPFLPQ